MRDIGKKHQASPLKVVVMRKKWISTRFASPTQDFDLDVLVSRLRKGFVLSTHKVAYLPGVESDYLDLPVLAAAAQDGLGWPGHPAITEIQRHLADAVNMALTGTMEPQQALDHAAAEVDEILADY